MSAATARDRRYADFTAAMDGRPFVRDAFDSVDPMIADKFNVVSVRVLQWIKRHSWGNLCLYCVGGDGRILIQADCARDLGLHPGTVSKVLHYLKMRGYSVKDLKMLTPIIAPKLDPPEKVAESATFPEFLEYLKVANTATFDALQAAQLAKKVAAEAAAPLEKVVRAEFRRWRQAQQNPAHPIETLDLTPDLDPERTDEHPPLVQVAPSDPEPPVRSFVPPPDPEPPRPEPEPLRIPEPLPVPPEPPPLTLRERLSAFLTGHCPNITLRPDRVILGQLEAALGNSEGALNLLMAHARATRMEVRKWAGFMPAATSAGAQQREYETAEELNRAARTEELKRMMTAYEPYSEEIPLASAIEEPPPAPPDPPAPGSDPDHEERLRNQRERTAARRAAEKAQIEENRKKYRLASAIEEPAAPASAPAPDPGPDHDERMAYSRSVKAAQRAAEKAQIEENRKKYRRIVEGTT